MGEFLRIEKYSDFYRHIKLSLDCIQEAEQFSNQVLYLCSICEAFGFKTNPYFNAELSEIILPSVWCQELPDLGCNYLKITTREWTGRESSEDFGEISKVNFREIRRCGSAAELKEFLLDLYRFKSNPETHMIVDKIQYEQGEFFLMIEELKVVIAIQGVEDTSLVKPNLSLIEAVPKYLKEREINRFWEVF